MTAKKELKKKLIGDARDVCYVFRDLTPDVIDCIDERLWNAINNLWESVILLDVLETKEDGV